MNNQNIRWRQRFSNNQQTANEIANAIQITYYQLFTTLLNKLNGL